MEKRDDWLYVYYCACIWLGARAKMQALATNVPEVKQVGGECKHVHDGREWKPFQENGIWRYPTKEEAEYTAALAFAIAVALSWWAVRTNRAKLSVPRMPRPSCVGSRVGWSEVPPEVARQWAMEPMAVMLGLQGRAPWDAKATMRMSTQQFQDKQTEWNKLTPTRGCLRQVPIMTSKHRFWF